MSNTITLGQAEKATGVTVLDHLDRATEIPVLTSLQRQGDVIVVPGKPGKGDARPVSTAGVPIVRSVAGGNTHLLLAGAGTVMWRPTPDAGSNVGVITVPDDAVAYIAHPEHGYLGIGPGTYMARRQREMRDQIRLVAD